MSKGKRIVSVKVIKGDINRALKKFKRGVMESGHLQELRERQYCTKPKTVRRKKKLQAIREQQKETILAKIEDGNTKLRFYTKKKNQNTKKVTKIQKNQKNP